MNDSTDSRVSLELAVAVPVERVWQALRDRDEVARWHGWEYDGLADEIEQIYFAGATVDDQARTLDTGDGIFELEDVRGGTVVHLRRPGLADNPRDGIDEGWLTFAQQLRFALEHHPGEDRRTIYVSGAARSEAVADPIATLGLGPAAERAPGDAYELDDVAGERLSGRVWFVSDFQLGLTVDDWGDGLLIVASAPTGGPHGSCSAVLTTYGLAAGRPAELESAWRSAWEAHYEPR